MEEVTTTQLMMGYMNGVMIIAAAFIAVAGIILAVGSSREHFGNCQKTFLLFSIALGAAAMTTALTWFDGSNTLLCFNVTTETRECVTKSFLFLQFFLWFIPLFRLFNKIGRVKSKNDKCGQVSEDKEKKEGEVDVGKELANIKCMIKRSDKISAGRTVIASGLPVFGIGLGQWLYGLFLIKGYPIFNTSEFYMLVIGGVLIISGFWVMHRKSVHK